jgi:hypothetical protein
MVSGSADGTARAWDLKNGDTYALYGIDAPILSLGLSADGRCFSCGDQKGRVWIFEWVNPSRGLPIATASHRRSHDLRIRCPICSSESKVRQSDLGATVSCRKCRAKVRLNRFTMGAPEAPPATTGAADEQTLGTSTRVSCLLAAATVFFGLLSLIAAIPAARHAYSETSSYALAVLLGLMIPFAVGLGAAQIALFNHRLRRLAHALLWPALAASVVSLAFWLSRDWTVAAVLGFAAGPVLWWMTCRVLFRGIDERRERAEKFQRYLSSRSR